MPPSISDTPGDPAPTPSPRFVWPADYYSSATPAPVLPRGGSYGCGAAAVVVLVIVFAGGAWLSSGGFTQFLDFAFGVTLGEMRGMYASDVTPAQKQTLEKEIETIRDEVRNGKVPVKNLQGLLQSMQKAMGDEKLTRAEVDELIAAAVKSQSRRGRPPTRKSQSLKVSESQRPPPTRLFATLRLCDFATL
jgi:hypothetical protein